MSKIYDAIMGLVVGDALGVPVEFKKRGTFEVKDMIGYGTYNQPPGTWSDDSSLTLATVESIGRLGKIDPGDIMENFFLWLGRGMFTPYGEVFDVGNGTRKAITRYAEGVNPLKCGGKSKMNNGNGALMRILPLALFPSSYKDVNEVSGLTHAHEISQKACRLYVGVAKMLLKGHSVADATNYGGVWSGEFSRIPKLDRLQRDEIRSSGYVVDTLEAALWCLMHTGSYRECVLTAVNLGEDTDTVAAVAGGLAGIVYGYGGIKGIPHDWIKQIAQKNWISELCGQFRIVQDRSSCSCGN